MGRRRKNAKSGTVDDVAPETFGDPWGYYEGSFDDPDAPGFMDAYYWAFVRDKDDEASPRKKRSKRPK